MKSVLPRWFAWIGLLLTAGVTAPAHATLVTDGSFETSILVDGPPVAFGDWGLDIASIVSAENGIVPADGVKMLRFDDTEILGQPGAGVIGDIMQPISVSGAQSVKASALFNRVAGNADTDTRFAIRIYAFSGTPSDAAPFNYRAGDSPNYLTDTATSIETDADPSTWEKVTTTLNTPAATTFIIVNLRAIENVEESDNPPFHGHYADAVSVIVPEPTSLFALAAFGLTAVIRRSRSSRRI